MPQKSASGTGFGGGGFVGGTLVLVGAAVGFAVAVSVGGGAGLALTVAVAAGSLVAGTFVAGTDVGAAVAAVDLGASVCVAAAVGRRVWVGEATIGCCVSVAVSLGFVVVEGDSVDPGCEALGAADAELAVPAAPGWLANCRGAKVGAGINANTAAVGGSAA